MHTSRKSWTQQQDQALRFLIQEIGEKKWSVIASTMQKQYGVKGKTGKKCRQRYINHLNPMIQNSKWNREEDQLLLKLHQQYGNKWSSISQNIIGKYIQRLSRSENGVKNRFYSKLRKILRKLNNFISDHSNLGLSTISERVISKIIQVSESKFKEQSNSSEYWAEFCSNVIEKMYNLKVNSYKSQIGDEENLLYVQIIKKITQFQVNFKKRKIQKKLQTQEDYKARNKQVQNIQMQIMQNKRVKSNRLINKSLTKQQNIGNNSTKDSKQQLQMINQTEMNFYSSISIYQQQLKTHQNFSDGYDLFQKSADSQMMLSLPFEYLSIFDFQDL